jgi:DNA-binding NtrC family response regulator
MMAIRSRDGEFFGSSEAMERFREKLDRAAATDVPVLLTGETGTGKTMAARYLHRRGRRSVNPFVQINCSAVPGTLFESELFGYEKGAFTGAQARRRGLLEQAHRGTLFLDEIGELPSPQQAKLLTALDDLTFRRVGGEQAFTVDVRLVSATVRDPESAIAAGELRADLFHRVAVLRLRVPPLRERREDILPTARRILDRTAARHGFELPRIERSGSAYLKELPWFGNVRELEHLLEAALVLGGGAPLTRAVLEEARPLRAPVTTPSPSDSGSSTPSPGSVHGPAAPEAPAGRYSFTGTEVEERELVERTLHRHRGNRTRAARELGMSRATLRGRIRRYGLEP